MPAIARDVDLLAARCERGRDPWADLVQIVEAIPVARRRFACAVITFRPAARMISSTARP